MLNNQKNQTEMIKQQMRCWLCKERFNQGARLPLVLNCGILICQLCLNSNAHRIRKTRQCAIHQNHRADDNGWRCLQSPHLITQLQIFQSIVQAIHDAKPQQPALKSELDDLENTRVILTNQFENSNIQYKNLLKEQRSLKEQISANKKSMSRQENSMRDELKNETERNKELDRQISQAYAELRKLEGLLDRTESKKKGKKRGMKEVKKEEKKAQQESQWATSKWGEILKQNQKTIEPQEQIPKKQNKYSSNNPFAIFDS